MGILDTRQQDNVLRGDRADGGDDLLQGLCPGADIAEGKKA